MVCDLSPDFSNLITITLQAPLAGLGGLTRSTSVLIADEFGVNVGEPSCYIKVPEFQQFKKYTLIMSNNNVSHKIT